MRSALWAVVLMLGACAPTPPSYVPVTPVTSTLECPHPYRFSDEHPYCSYDVLGVQERKTLEEQYLRSIEVFPAFLASKKLPAFKMIKPWSGMKIAVAPHAELVRRYSFAENEFGQSTWDGSEIRVASEMFSTSELRYTFAHEMGHVLYYRFLQEVLPEKRESLTRQESETFAQEFETFYQK